MYVERLVSVGVLRVGRRGFGGLGWDILWLMLAGSRFRGFSASFATFEPCKSHTMHKEVTATVVAPGGIFRPIATALRTLPYLFYIDLE